MKKRLEEIEKRLAELQGLIDAEKDVEKITAYGDELKSLLEERGMINGEMLGRAKQEAKDILDKAPEAKIAEREKGEARKMTKREAFSLLCGLNARKKAPTEVQKRDLMAALTTTAEKFITGDALTGVEGVNNGGVFVPTSLLFDLLVEEGKLSPLTRDIAFTAIKGYTRYVYRASRDKANAKAEGKGTGRNQMEWATLELVKGKLQIVIDVTDELSALTDIDLGAYISRQILEDLDEDWAADLIYGIGSDNHVKGITNGATSVTYTAGDGASLASIVSAIKQCKAPYRKGAKVYVSQEVYDDIFFSIDEQGNFKYPVFNNATGISSLGPIRVELDENLKDGDYVIGNVSKWYKANLVENMRIGIDRQEVEGITTYVATQHIWAAPFVGASTKAFIHGSKKGA